LCEEFAIAKFFAESVSKLEGKAEQKKRPKQETVSLWLMQKDKLQFSWSADIATTKLQWILEVVII
jgi:hypothetical protein